MTRLATCSAAGIALAVCAAFAGCSPSPSTAAAPANEPVPASSAAPQKVAPRAAREKAPTLLAADPPARRTPAPAATLDWPGFRGPGGLGISPSRLPDRWSADTNVVWKTPLPGPGSSSPIVVGDRVFLTCHTGYGIQPGGDQSALKRLVVCVNRADGKILWSKEAKSTLPEQPYDNRMLNHGYTSSTPAADAERVYAFFGRSGVFAFDHQGKQLWQAPVGDTFHEWGSGASPLLHGDLVIINASVESESLIALNRRTGKEVWRTGGIREAWNTPAIVPLPGGKSEIVVGVFGGVRGFDPATGAALWNAKGIDCYVCPSPVAHDGVVYVTAGRDRQTVAIRAGGRGDVTNTHTLWRAQKGSNVSSPIYHEGHLYLSNDSPGVAYCLNARTGEVLYEERLGRGEVYGSPVLAGGNLYYPSRHGTVLVVPAKPQFQLLAENSLGERGRTNASPAVAGGRLFLRTDQSLYCIGEK